MQEKQGQQIIMDQPTFGVGSACLCFLNCLKSLYALLWANFLQWFISFGWVPRPRAILSIPNQRALHLSVVGLRSGQSMAQVGVAKSIFYAHHTQIHATSCHLVVTSAAEHRVSCGKKVLDCSLWTSESDRPLPSSVQQMDIITGPK